MRKQAALSADADRDIRGYAERISDDNLDAALRFADAVDQARELLAKMPEIGTVHDFGQPDLAGLRMWPIRGFEKYLIFYRPTEDSAEVVRVLHASQDTETVLLGES